MPAVVVVEAAHTLTPPTIKVAATANKLVLRIRVLPSNQPRHAAAQADGLGMCQTLAWADVMAIMKWSISRSESDMAGCCAYERDAMVEAEAAFKADLEKLLKNEGHMPEGKFLVMSRKGKRLGVAFASTPRGEGGAASLKFKTK